MEGKAYEFQEFYIPERMMPGIKRYLEHGIKPGRFLSAIIQNNLSQTVGQADSENLRNIPAYAAYFYNECSLDCWGSPQKMNQWIEKFKKVSNGEKEQP